MPIHMRLTHFPPNPPQPPIIKPPPGALQVCLLLRREWCHARRVGGATCLAAREVDCKRAGGGDVAGPVPGGEGHGVEETTVGSGAECGGVVSVMYLSVVRGGGGGGGGGRGAVRAGREGG